MRKPLVLTFIISLLVVLNFGTSAAAQDLKKLRVGALKFGTVNWTLDVLKHHALDKKHGIDLEIVPLGSKNASHVTIQGGGAEMIVSDWIWVSRQRAEGRDYTFVPYSNATGALMVKADSGINSLADMKDKSLGVAGGPVDKSWLFLRAYAQKNEGLDLAELVEPKFAAPPLLNKLAQRGELDGVLNFWHYTAKLQSSGFKSILSVSDALKGLEIERSIPVIGWVFQEQWASENIDIVKGFVAAAREAQQLLLNNDEEWSRIKDQMKAKNETVFITLRDAYRKGVPACFEEADRQAAASAYAILAGLGGKKLVGDATKLNDGTFWKPYQTMDCNG